MYINEMYKENSVGEGGTDKHTNIAFIPENMASYVMTEDISETIRNNEEIQYGRQAKTEIQPIAKIMDYYHQEKITYKFT